MHSENAKTWCNYLKNTLKGSRRKACLSIPDGYLERTGDDDEERDEEMAVADEEVAVDNENDHMEVVEEEMDYQPQLLESPSSQWQWPKRMSTTWKWQ